MKDFLPRLGLACLLFFAMACGDSAAKLAEHVSRGQAYLDEGKYAEAAIEYKTALQIDPNSADAHWGLAIAYTGDKKPREAYWELKETVRLDPSNHEAKLRYGRYLLYGKEEDIEEAIQRADEVIAAAPERWEAHILKGRANQALDRGTQARASYQKAIEIAPEAMAPLLQLANFEQSLGNSEAADAAYRRLTEVQPSFVAWGAFAGFLAAEQRYEESEKAYREALAVADATNRKSATELLANFLMARKRFGEAEQLLLDELESAPGDIDRMYRLARFYNDRGEGKKAADMIEKAAQVQGDSVRPHIVLSLFRGRQGDAEGALAAVEKALEVEPNNLGARLRKAELLVDVGYRNGDSSQIAEGSAIIEAALAEDPSRPGALFVKGKIDLAENRPDDAIAALRRCIDVRSDWAQPHFLLGSALILSRDLTGARTATFRALELDPGMLEAKMLLARIHASGGEWELAVEAGRDALLRVPQDHGLRIVVAQSLVRLGRLEQAREELLAIPMEKRDAEAHYALGRTELLRGNRAEARASLQAAYEADSSRFEVLRALLDLDLREKRLDESAKRVRTAILEKPEDPKLTQLLGLVALYSGDSGQAERHFRRAIELDPNDLSGYENLARYLLVSGKSEELLATYEKALQNNPNSGVLHLIVGSLYELQSRTSEAIERYESAVKIDPTLAVAKNNLAYLLSETGGDLDRALSLAQEAKELLPDNPNASDTLGWVLFKKKVPSAAIGYLREAERGLSPEDPQLGTVRHHLAQAYEANGQREQALEVLDRALRELKGKAAEPPWAVEARTMHERLSANEG